MESHESFIRPNAVALLRQMKCDILSAFVEAVEARSGKPASLATSLPELLDRMFEALDQETSSTVVPLEAWAGLPLPSLIGDISLVRTLLSRSLSDPSLRDRMHQFLDRCLEALAAQHEHSEQAAQQRLYDFLQLIPTPVCVMTGEERVITFANRAYEKFMGRPVQGHKADEIFDHEQLKYYSPLLDSVSKSGQPGFVNEIEIPPAAGSSDKSRWIDASYYPLKDRGQAAHRVMAVHCEVTDRVVNRARREHSERRLRQTEDQLNRAMKVSKVGFFDWDLPQNLIHLNRQMRADWGTEVETLTPAALDAMIHPDDRATTCLAVREAIAQHKPFAIHVRVIREDDQRLVWIEVQGEITYDDENKPLRFFGTSRNITERKEGELRLAAEKHKFQAIFHDAPAPMVLWRGPDFIFDLVNPQFEGFFQDREFIGKKLVEAIPELQDQPFIEFFQTVYSTGQTISAKEFPTKIARSCGGPVEEYFIDFSLSRIMDGEGRPYGVFCHVVNVTDKVKVRDEARAASASKSHFLANMSHEIRTPLGAILGFSALLRDPLLPESERGVFVDTIVRNGEALTRIIDDILDLAKVEAGRLEVESIDFGLSGLIHEVLSLLQERAQKKQLRLAACFGPDVPERIGSDPLRLRQILVNLLSNAVKFTAAGRVELQVKAEKADNTWIIHIEVTDTGIGLTPEQSARLFQPFAQADHTTTRKFGGTGLGLALSQRLAEALGGRITIPFTEMGKGSTFCLEFTAQVASASAESEPQPRKVPLESIQLTGLRVLAVDDSPDNLFLVKSFLARSGALVATATNGRQAIDLAFSHAYDIILLDIQMPEMDGYEAIEILRERGYKNPVVALTAHAMVDERHHTQKAGFNAHLTKPLDALELVSTVARLTSPGAEHWLGSRTHA